MTGLSEDGAGALGVGEDKAALIALNKEDGRIAWAFGLESRSESSPVAIYDKEGNGWIVQCEQAGIVHLLDGLTGGIYDSIVLSEGVIEASPAVYDNYVVVGTSHAMHIEEHVPPYFGIITVEFVGDEADLYILRRPAKSPEFDIALKLQILWRPELNRLLDLNCLPAYRQKSKAYIRKVLLDRVMPNTLNSQISEMLFERDYSTIEEQMESARKRVSGRRKGGRKWH